MTGVQTTAVADTGAPADLVLRARRTWIDGVFRPAAVVVRDGRVASVEPLDAGLAAHHDETVPDAHVLLPGLVDTHVHVNEPGRTEWEGFASATRAAALGGVTTIIDMPLNSIPATVDVPALEAKRASAAGRVAVDVGFWGGAVPGNAGALGPLHEAGVFGFKCFTAPSGVDEFPHLDPAGRAGPLGLERRDVDGRGDRVERHVDDRRHTPQGGGAGR
jgi:allantoinase